MNNDVSGSCAFRTSSPEEPVGMIEKIKRLVSCDDLPELLKTFLQLALEEVRAERGVLLLLQDVLLAEKKLNYIKLSNEGEEEQGGYVYDSLVGDQNTLDPDAGPEPMRSVMREVLARGSPAILAHARTDPRAEEGRAPTRGRRLSAVCLPVKATDLIGLLYLDHSSEGYFRPRDCQRLQLLTSIASLRIVNLLNLRFQFILATAITQFNSALERSRLIEVVLNELKMKLGFTRALFFRMLPDQKAAVLDRTLPEEIWDTLVASVEPRIELTGGCALCDLLLKGRHIVSAAGLRGTTGNVLTAYINGARREITNPRLVEVIQALGSRPFLAIPLYTVDHVIGFWMCDKLGLPIILGQEGKDFVRSFFHALALAIERADQYHEMEKRLNRSYGERLRRESLASVASLLKDLSHVISSPVRKIINASSMIAGNIELAVQNRATADTLRALQEGVEMIRSASTLTRTYVTYLRDLAHVEQLEPGLMEADIGACIRSAWVERVALFYPSVRMVFSENGAPIEPFLFDPLQITSVMANLFMNAARAMKNSGGRIEVSACAAGQFVRIDVEDDGPGIPEDILKDIFSLELRMRPSWRGEGAGTGLLICKEIIFRHRGNMEITSKGGTHRRRYGAPAEFIPEKRQGGTRVSIELPYCRVCVGGGEKALYGLR